MSKRPALAPTLKLAAFGVVAVLVTLTIAATIRPIGSGSGTRHFTAELTSASRLEPGDDIRVAGVKVGRVSDVSVTPDAHALVGLDVASDLPVTERTRVEVRYLDLAGNRYVALVDPGTPAPAQPAGTTIGLDRTSPALDLDDLLDGFKPLLVALSPEEVNNLTLDIVRTLQGDGGTVRHLLRRTASLTTGLARRDQLITSVIDHLDTSVGTLDGHEQQLRGLVHGLRVFTSGLSADRRDVTNAIGHLDDMTGLTAALLRHVRPSTKADVAEVRRLAEILSTPRAHRLIEHALRHLPVKLRKLQATAGYGSWFNYYVCGVRLSTGAGTGLDPQAAHLLQKLHLVDTSRRCTP
ncbi:MAG: MCE family protein [Nocardioides sp.]